MLATTSLNGAQALAKYRRRPRKCGGWAMASFVRDHDIWHPHAPYLLPTTHVLPLSVPLSQLEVSILPPPPLAPSVPGSPRPYQPLPSPQQRANSKPPRLAHLRNHTARIFVSTTGHSRALSAPRCEEGSNVRRPIEAPASKHKPLPSRPVLVISIHT